jgi:hypothetical protein
MQYPRVRLSRVISRRQTESPGIIAKSVPDVRREASSLMNCTAAGSL